MTIRTHAPRVPAGVPRRATEPPKHADFVRTLEGRRAASGR
jgi:hypothetical protein